MNVELKKQFQMGSSIFKPIKEEADHKKLARHIIKLNQQNSIQDIIHEASVYFKSLFSYSQFAFAIKGKTGIDVWLDLDPRMDRKSFESVLIQDFHLYGESAINYRNHTFGNDEEAYSLNVKNHISYNLSEGICQARIYIFSKLNTQSYQDDIIDMLLKSTGIALAKQMNIEQLVRVATRDPLTECYNRREFERQMEKTITSANCYKTPLALIMFEIDHFNKINDAYGKQVGDEVLKEVSHLVQTNIRNDDGLARYSKTEFIAILPSTEKREGMEIADRLRKKIENYVSKTGFHNICVTASFGISRLDVSHKKKGSSQRMSLVEDAASMMHKAKLNGRNTVMPGLLQLCNSSQATAALTGTI